MAAKDYFQRVDLRGGAGDTLLNRTQDNVREDFMDAIYNISPVDTPFMSGIGRASCKDVFTSWQQDDIAEPDETNAAIDGDDIGPDSSQRARRVGNINQISRKSLGISGRAEVVDKAGRSSEMAYQLAKAAKALKRDMEAILTGNQAAVGDTVTPGSEGTTATKLGSLRACFRNAVANTQEVTTALVGAGAGANGGVGAASIPTAAVKGTARPLSETLINQAMQAAYVNGGQPDTLMVTPKVKAALSAYLYSSSARVAALYSEIAQSKREGGVANASVDIYVTDFGPLKIVPSRFMGYTKAAHAPDHSSVYLLDMAMWAVGFLRPFRTMDVAKLGDSERKMLLVDYTLIYKQEMASGLVADVDPAVAVIA